MFIIYKILFLALRVQWSKSLLVRFAPPKIPHPLAAGKGVPLKKHWRWEYIHTSKTSKFNVNDNPVTQYRNFRRLKTPAATPVN